MPALALYASQPDVVAEIKGVAGRLRDVPRHWLDSREDMINGLQREGAHLLKLADKIETIEPIAKKAGAPQLARIARKPTRRPAGAGQFEMAL